MPLSKQLALGLSGPFHGLRWMVKSSGLALALGIGILSGCFLVALLVLAIVLATPLTQWITSAEGFWFWIVWIGVLVAQLPLVLLVHRGAATLLTGGLQARLSREIDDALNPGRVFPKAGGGPSVGAVFLQLSKTIFLAVGVLLLNVIPVVGQVLSLMCAVYVSSGELARDLVTYPMERRGLDDQAISQELATHRALWRTMGAVFTLMSMVPVLNFVAIPAAVAAVTHRYAELEKKRLPPG